MMLESGSVSLVPMTGEMYHAFFREYENDRELYLDPADYRVYVYSHETVERYIQRQILRQRIPLAILCGEEIVGELKFYDIRPEESAVLGIALKNPGWKNRGIGTQAERLAIAYAFYTLNVPILYADTVLTNTRSQHVLEKVGFTLYRQDSWRRYYICRRQEYEGKNAADSGADAPV